MMLTFVAANKDRSYQQKARSHKPTFDLDDSEYIYESFAKQQCSQISSIEDKFGCFASYLPPLKDNVRSSFMKCFVDCDKADNKDQCVSDCNDIVNPSDDSEACLLQCGKLQSPIKQSQCMGQCRNSARIRLDTDCTDGCNRCKKFVDFSKSVLASSYPTFPEFKSALEVMCASNINALPICQALSKIDTEQLFQLIQTSSEGSICQQLLMC